MYKAICILCAGLCCALLLKAETNPPKRFALRIEVTDSVTGKLLEAASITLAETQWHAITNSQGMVQADSLPKGWYTVQCTFVGYHALQQKVWIERETFVKLELCSISHHLHEAIVTQSKVSAPISSLLANAQLDEGMIQRLRGQNLGDLLANINGVTVLNTGPGISKPVIRGLHSNRLVLLNNGIQQEGQQWGAEHAPEIDPFAVQRVEIIKGASSVEFGPEAIGGVVRLSPLVYKGDNGMEGELASNFFTNNYQGSASLMIRGTHFKQQQFSWKMQGSLRKAGDAHAPDYVISNTGFTGGSGLVSARYVYHNWNVEAGLSFFQTRLGIMRAAHVGNSTDLYRAIQSSQPLIILPFTYQIQKPYQQVWHETQWLKVERVFKVGVLNLQLSRQLNSRQEYDLGVSWNRNSITHQKPAYDLSLTTFGYGCSFNHKTYYKFTGKIGMSVMSQSNITDGTQRPIIPNFASHTLGVFWMEKWKYKRWTAEVGSRIDVRKQTVYYRLSNDEIQSETNQFSRPTFIGGAGYYINEHLVLASTISSAWRPPAINELYSNGLHNATATYEVGNANLVPETSINWDVTAKYQQPKYTTTLNVYRNVINNFIYQLPVQPPTITLRGAFPTFVFTQTNAVLQGFELSHVQSLTHHFSALLALNYLHAQDMVQQVPLIYMPANRGKMSLHYQNEKLWRFTNLFLEGGVQYVATQTRFPQGIDYANPPAAYSLLEANAGFDIPIQHQHLRVSISLNNALNQRYRDYLNRFRYFTDEAGRNLIIRVSIPFTLIKPQF